MTDREFYLLAMMLLWGGVIVALGVWVVMLAVATYRMPWERKGWKGGAAAAQPHGQA